MGGGVRPLGVRARLCLGQGGAPGPGLAQLEVGLRGALAGAGGGGEVERLQVGQHRGGEQGVTLVRRGTHRL